MLQKYQTVLTKKRILYETKSNGTDTELNLTTLNEDGFTIHIIIVFSGGLPEKFLMYQSGNPLHGIPRSFISQRANDFKMVYTDKKQFQRAVSDSILTNEAQISDSITNAYQSFEGLLKSIKSSFAIFKEDPRNAIRPTLFDENILPKEGSFLDVTAQEFRNRTRESPPDHFLPFKLFILRSGNTYIANALIYTETNIANALTDTETTCTIAYSKEISLEEPLQTTISDAASAIAKWNSRKKPSFTQKHR